MKFSLALISALAATASAVPIRIFTFTEAPSNEYNAPHRIHPDAARPYVPGMAPCHGENPAPSRMSLDTLLVRLGFTSDQPRAPHPHHEITREDESDADEKWQVVSALKDEEAMHRKMEGWKHHVEEMIHSAEDRVVPILQGGSVRILPAFNEDGEFEHHDEEKHRFHGGWKALEGKGGVKKHHHHGHAHGHRGHHQPKTFMCRLGKALRSLTPMEGTIVMFVLGAGLGSLLHLVFALVFLTFRRIRCGKSTCAQRRAARQARREARKAGKAGKIVLEGSEGEEVAPLVEKA